MIDGIFKLVVVKCNCVVGHAVVLLRLQSKECWVLKWDQICLN